MVRGRPPKPTALKIATGNPGRRPLNGSEPKPDPTPPKCPAWLDAEAKRVWKQLAGELHRLGLLTSVDGQTLACLSQAWAEFKAATETLRHEGRFVMVGGELREQQQPPTEMGVIPPPVWVRVGGHRQTHPAVSQQRTAWKAVKEFSALFGLDPSSRSRLHVGEAEEVDELQAFNEEMA